MVLDLGGAFRSLARLFSGAAVSDSAPGGSMAGSGETSDVFISTLVATVWQRRLAWGVVAVSILVFLVAAPFAKVPLVKVPAFIPIYESALVINDLITAILLFGQFGILRSRALLVLAVGYLFTAFVAVAHALTFPGLFAPTGLLGAGPQSTAWLYMFWHGGFPLFVIAYVQLTDGVRASLRLSGRPALTVVCCVGAVLAAVCGFVQLTTTGQSLLPNIMQGNHYTSTMIGVVSSVWALSMLALIFLWRRRPHSVLDLWLMVVMCAWMCDIALSAVLNAGRFDLGFYVGRIYGLLASSFVLAVLLLENGLLYARLAEAHASERHKSAELEAANRDLESFSYSVSHDLRAPLRAIDGFSKMLARGYSEQLDDEGKRLLGVVVANCKQMGQLIDDLLAYSRLGRQPLRRQPVDLSDFVSQIFDGLRTSQPERVIEFMVGALGSAQIDPSLFKQVLVNLISNAIKFTRDKTPAVIEIGREDGGDAPTIYYVKDNGAGFDMRYAERLFGVFQRLHSNTEFEGTGVGLAIVQRIINSHGGRIWADAKVGEGATFYFTLSAAGTVDGVASKSNASGQENN
ncbi:MASE4 domain-containing protein [Andreprevotia chitinilytica]|uniref:MASE4 domain-containing protein n=1 Tax=Andreprevotia chitinilytica TaxID=396808 RepID=UPI0006919806|nr:MASE4 domain-containing protein [Andreprevotia chitinilytica]